MPNTHKIAPVSEPPPSDKPILNVGSSPAVAAPSPAADGAVPRPNTDAKEASAYEFLGHLPDSYGSRKLFLVAQNPQVLFAYWDLSPAQYQEGARTAHDRKIFLEVYVPGEGRVQQIHVWDTHKNWYLQVNRPDTAFVAQLGYYPQDGAFEVLARSEEIRTPRDTLSPHTEARFVTIPFDVSFRELSSLIAQESLPGEELAETLSRLQRSDFGLPFQARAPRDLTAAERDGLLEQLGDEEVRRRMVGSFEMTELLRKRFESMVSSGQWASSAGAWVTSASSPFGASFGHKRGFHLHVNAELIIYGGTEPNAKVRIDGRDIALSQDGAVSYHFTFPDGRFHIPIAATSVDGVETRSALLSFVRLTERSGDVRQTGQPVLDEPFGRNATASL